MGRVNLRIRQRVSAARSSSDSEALRPFQKLCLLQCLHCTDEAHWHRPKQRQPCLQEFVRSSLLLPIWAHVEEFATSGRVLGSAVQLATNTRGFAATFGRFATTSGLELVSVSCQEELSPSGGRRAVLRSWRTASTQPIPSKSGYFAASSVTGAAHRPWRFR